MDDREIKLRCIEAAAKSPIVHQDGPAVGVREVASVWFDWIISSGAGDKPAGTLRLPGKK